MRLRKSPMWSSHLPVLIPLLQQTTGPVVELGCGFFSTPVIHWLCATMGRALFTYEGNEDWYEQLSGFHRGKHRVRFVDNWDDIDLTPEWGLAFVDHAPAERRYEDILRLTHAQFVIAHDAGNTASDYGYDKISTDDFQHIYRYTGAFPRTAILSNFHDPREFLGSSFLKPGVRGTV